MVKFTNEMYAGLLPDLIHEGTGMKVAEQLQYSYAHGGGWNPFHGFTYNREAKTLTYPGDPPMHVMCEAECGGEKLYLFEHAWLLIEQPDGSWEVARVD